MEETKTVQESPIYLVCLLGENPQVVMEIIECLTDENPLHEWSIPTRKKIDEVWLVGSDYNDNPDNGFDGNMKQLKKYLAEKKPISIVWRYFIIKDTGDVENEAQNFKIAEGILRVLLLAQKQIVDTGQIWISIAGGRKTMSAYGFMGQFLVPLQHIFHIVAPEKLEEFKDIKDIRRHWNNWKGKKPLKELVGPISLPGIQKMDNLFRQFFLGLGRELNCTNYPLQVGLDYNRLPRNNDEEYYIIPDNISLLKDIVLVSNHIGPLISLSEGVSFNFFRHDMSSFHNEIAKENDFSKRLEWSYLLDKYMRSLETFGICSQRNPKEIFIPETCVVETEEEILNELETLVGNTLTLVEKKWVKADFSERNYNRTFEKTTKTIKFTVQFTGTSFRIPHPKYLLYLLRNIVHNMKKNGKEHLHINFDVQSSGLIIIASNSLNDNDKKFLMENKENLGLPFLKPVGSTTSGKGLGMYTIRATNTIFGNIDSPFAVDNEKNLFGIRLLLKCPQKKIEKISNNIHVLQWDTTSSRVIPIPANEYRRTVYSEEFAEWMDKAKVLCIHYNDFEKCSYLHDKVIKWIETNPKQCYFFSDSEELTLQPEMAVRLKDKQCYKKTWDDVCRELPQQIFT